MRSSMGLAGADSFPSVFSVMYGWIITSSSVFLMTPTSCWNFSLITLFLSGKSFGSQPSCTGVRSSPISLYLFVWRFGVVDFCLAFAYGFCMIAFPDSAGVNVGSVAVAFSVFQIATAAHFIDFASQVVRAFHVGFLMLLTFPLIAIARKKSG